MVENVFKVYINVTFTIQKKRETGVIYRAKPSEKIFETFKELRCYL